MIATSATTPMSAPTAFTIVLSAPLEDVPVELEPEPDCVPDAPPVELELLDEDDVIVTEEIFVQLALLLSLPSVYGRNWSEFCAVESCTSDEMPAKYCALGSFTVGPASVCVVFDSTLITYVWLPSLGTYANSCCTPLSWKNEAVWPCEAGNVLPSEVG